jgi:hypothetical protein
VHASVCAGRTFKYLLCLLTEPPAVDDSNLANAHRPLTSMSSALQKSLDQAHCSRTYLKGLSINPFMFVDSTKSRTMRDAQLICLPLGFVLHTRMQHIDCPSQFTLVHFISFPIFWVCGSKCKFAFDLSIYSYSTGKSILCSCHWRS